MNSKAAQVNPVIPFISLCALVICFAATAAADVITSQELESRIAQTEMPLVLDVRSQEEFAAGHIPGAVNIPVTELIARSSELSQHKNEEIVVYCQYGPRAAFAKYIMMRNGFTHIRDLQGHMHKWLAEAHPVAKSRN